MPHDRFFIDIPLTVGAPSLLSQEESSHLKTVMKKRVGDVVELCNGKGQLATARIGAFHKNGIEVIPLTSTSTPKSSSETTLIQALLHPKLLDLVVEKGTELGIDNFLFFPGEKSIKEDLSKNQLERLTNITIAALKQSGRLYLPTISLLPPIKSWKPFTSITYFGSLKATSSTKPTNCCIIGPESGFTPNEEDFLIQLGAIPVSFSKNILRAETASLVACIHLCN